LAVHILRHPDSLPREAILLLFQHEQQQLESANSEKG
jgi:hypothetical protein